MPTLAAWRAPGGRRLIGLGRTASTVDPWLRRALAPVGAGSLGSGVRSGRSSRRRGAWGEGGRERAPWSLPVRALISAQGLPTSRPRPNFILSRGPDA